MRRRQQQAPPALSESTPRSTRHEPSKNRPSGRRTRHMRVRPALPISRIQHPRHPEFVRGKRQLHHRNGGRRRVGLLFCERQLRPRALRLRRNPSREPPALGHGEPRGVQPTRLQQPPRLDAAVQRAAVHRGRPRIGSRALEDKWHRRRNHPGVRLRAGPAAGGPTNFVRVGNLVYLSAYGGPATGTELWVTDGTTQGTSLVADIQPGTSGSGPTSLVAVGNEIYFAASVATLSTELWKSDGTAAGTTLVFDLPGAGLFPAN